MKKPEEKKCHCSDRTKAQIGKTLEQCCCDGHYNQGLKDMEVYHKESIWFWETRLNALQKAQKDFREPERTIVCNILANGRKSL